MRRSGLGSIRFTSPGPRRDDLANHWAHGPLVRSLILPVDSGDIRPPQAPDLWVDFEITGPYLVRSCNLFDLRLIGRSVDGLWLVFISLCASMLLLIRLVPHRLYLAFL